MFQVRVGYAREFCNITLAGYCISFYRALDGLLCSPLCKTDPWGDLWVGDQLAGPLRRSVAATLSCCRRVGTPRPSTDKPGRISPVLGSDRLSLRAQFT